MLQQLGWLVHNLTCMCCVNEAHKGSVYKPVAVLPADVMQQLSSSSMLISAAPSTALSLLQTWITQPGFPLINLSADGASVEQSRYYDWGSNIGNDPFVTGSNSTWYVPLGSGQLASSADSQNNGLHWQEIVNQSSMMMPDAILGASVLNAGGSGYYRCVTAACCMHGVVMPAIA